MSTPLKYTFIVHLIVAVVFGLPLVLFPGLFLGSFGWAPVDPLLSRVLGAALLAAAWTSFRVVRGGDASVIGVVLEMELVFAVLAAIGLLRHLLIAYYPPMVWLTFALFVAFAVAWGVLLVARGRRHSDMAAHPGRRGAAP